MSEVIPFRPAPTPAPTPEPASVACEKCDDTGWARHPWRDGYVWCDCARGQRFRSAHHGKRSGDGTWTKAGKPEGAA